MLRNIGCPNDICERILRPNEGNILVIQPRFLRQEENRQWDKRQSSMQIKKLNEASDAAPAGKRGVR